MMKLRFLSISKLLIPLLSFVILVSCEPSEYDKLVRTEYNKNVRNDSLFLGFYFGKTQKEFFSTGWEMNKKGLIRQGPQNQTVSYSLTSPDGRSDMEMLFYPEFGEDLKLETMPMRFMYKGWAPWNRRLFSDSLLFAIKDTLMDWYGGNEFHLYEKPDQGISFWYKVDGNRQITLAATDEKEVKAVIKDLYHPDNDPLK